MGNTLSLDWRLDEHKDLPSSWTDIENIIAKGSAEPETPEWKRFTEMKAFDLHDNALVSIPSAIGRLASLTSLVLHSNKLAELPTEIVELQHLQCLDVHNNQIRTLPEGLSVLILLRYVDVSFNRLASLPADFPVVVARLDTLYLSHNPFDGDLPLKSALEKADLSAYRRLLEGGGDGVNHTEKKATKAEVKPGVPNVDLNAIARASGTTLPQSPRIAHKRRPPSKAHIEAQKIQAEELREALSIKSDDDGELEKKSEGPIIHGSAPSVGSAPSADYQTVGPANPMAAAGLADIMKSGIGGLKLRKAGVTGSIGSSLKSTDALDQASGPPIPQHGSASGLLGVQLPAVSAENLGSLRRVHGKEASSENGQKEKEQEQEKEKEREREINMQNENKEKEKQPAVTEAGKANDDKDRPIPRWKQKTASPAPSDAGSGGPPAATSTPIATPVKLRPTSLYVEAGLPVHQIPKPSSGSPTVRPFRSNSGSSQDFGGKKDKDGTDTKIEVDGSIPPWKRELMERKAKAAAQK